MKDVAPRIFRVLETQDGRPGFDAIVNAAVAAYTSLRAPSRAQCAEFGRLVSPLWGQVLPETRRSLAANLSHTHRVPAEIVDLVVDASPEISAPFLVSSPALSAEHLERLAGRGDERLARILQGRKANGLDAAPLEPAATVGHPVVEAPPLAPEHLGAVPPERPAQDAAEFVRDTLRRLARTVEPQGERIGAALLRAARSPDAPVFFETLAARLGLSPAERASIEDDESGRSLAVILKELGIATGEALAILMLVRPQIGLDVRAFERMAAHYRALTVESARPEAGASRPAAQAQEPAPREPRAAPARPAAPAAPKRRTGSRRGAKG